MIDFTNAIEEINNYKGSEKKKTLIYLMFSSFKSN